MRYRSFSPRDRFILKQMPLNKNLSFLEIGVGLGTMVDLIKERVREYYGVDVSYELIAYLSLIYQDDKSLNWRCLDVCQRLSFLNKKFDFVFSAETLEHLEKPAEYFNFIKRHLKPEGIVLILFPNESKEKHHGITWFEDKKQLLEIIDRAGFQIEDFFELRKTFWHKIIKKSLWEFPKLMLSKSKENPQTFEKTQAFKIASSKGIKVKMFTFYAKIATKLAEMFPLYKHRNIIEDIKNKNIFLRLKHK